MSMRLIAALLALAACPDPSAPPIEPPVQRPVIQVTPAAVDFGQQQVGTEHPGRDVTIRNDGQAALDVYEILVVEPDEDFSVGLGWGSGGVRVPAGSARTFVVRFAPTRPEVYRSQIRVFSNASPRGNEVFIPIEGTGVSPRIDVVDQVVVLDPTSPARIELELRNVGQARLAIQEFAVRGSPAFGIDLDPDRNGALPFELAPLDPDTDRPVRSVFVTWDADLAEGDDTAELSIRSNDFEHPVRTVALVLPD